MTCLEIAMETLNTGNLVLKNVFKSSYGDDLEHSLRFLLSSPSAYYSNVPELRSAYRLNLGFNRPFRRSVAWLRHNTHTTNCLKQCFTLFIRSNNFQGFLEQKCPSGIGISFTCRWRKLAGGFPLKERWMVEFLSFFLLSQRPLLCSWSQTNPPANSSSRRCSDRILKRLLRLALVYHCRHISMRRQTERREHNWAAALQTPVSVATASHTHMRWIKGQGSWVVLVRAQWSSVCHYRYFQ